MNKLYWIINASGFDSNYGSEITIREITLNEIRNKKRVYLSNINFDLISFLEYLISIGLG